MPSAKKTPSVLSRKTILLAVLILVIIAGGAYMLGTKNQPAAKNSDSSTTPVTDSLVKDPSEFFPITLGGKNIQRNAGLQGFVVLPIKFSETDSYTPLVAKGYTTTYISDPYVEDKVIALHFINFKDAASMEQFKQKTDAETKTIPSPAEVVTTDITNSWFVVYNNPSREWGVVGGKDGKLYMLLPESHSLVQIEFSGYTRSEMIATGHEYLSFINKRDPYARVDASKVLTDMDRYDALLKQRRDLLK